MDKENVLGGKRVNWGKVPTIPWGIIQRNKVVNELRKPEKGVAERGHSRERTRKQGCVCR